MRKYLILGLLAFASCAFAHDDGKDCPQPVSQPASVVNQYTSYSYNVDVPGVASAIAMAQIHVDWHSNAVYGGVGFGNFHGTNALTFGLAKKVGHTMFSLSVAREDNLTSVGAGISWRF